MKLVSFSFKKLLVSNCTEKMFDVRHFPNPHKVATLRDRTGLDPQVGLWMECQRDFPKDYALLKSKVLSELAVGTATVYIGCYGGRHRSVALAEKLAKELKLVVEHRELNGLVHDYRESIDEILEKIDSGEIAP